MSAFNGTVMLLSLEGTPLALQTDATLNIEQDLPDATHKSSGGWADHINGLRSWSIDVDGRASIGNTGNFAVLFDLIANRENVAMEFAPSTGGGVKVTGNVSLANVSLGAPLEDTASLSGTLTGKGELSKAVVS